MSKRYGHLKVVGSEPAWNRGRKLPAEILTEAEVVALVRAASNRAPTGIRNRALVTLMYRSGLRVSEAALEYSWNQIPR